MIRQFRTHDDCDGDHTQGLEIVTDPMGDIYVCVHPGPFASSVRFRTWGGGGMSPNVHAALRALADAITLDNASTPFEGGTAT